MPRAFKLGFILVALAFALPAAAQNSSSPWPARPVKVVVASAPGGGTDTVARVLAQHFSKTLGQQFYVENRPGAGNVRGSETVAKAAPDGYTLLVSASTLAINHVMRKNLPYDVKRDFTPITQLVVMPNVFVVGPRQPYRSIADFIAAAKAKPNELSYASAGAGTAPHMAMELFRTMSGTDLLHVPYTGVGPALIDIMGDRVTTMMVNFLSAKPQIDAGTLRPLAISSLTRSRFLPDVPTMTEAGLPGYEASQWFGLLGPAGLPEDITGRLYREARTGLHSPEMKIRLETEGAEPVGNTPSEFAALIAEEMEKWGKVGLAAGIKAE